MMNTTGMLIKTPLPTSIEDLQTLCVQQQTTINEQTHALKESSNRLKIKDQYIEQLEERLSLLLSQRYQAQSESPANTTENESKPKHKTPPKRESLPSHLRRVDIVIDVSDEDKHMMRDDWVLVGYETSEQLAVKQREYFVKQFKRAKYALNDGLKKAQHATQAQPINGILVAPRPQVMLPKALADASLLADIIASKFVDALSFYRKMKILEREQINIGYSTVCDWPIQLNERLHPIKRLLYEQLSSVEVWHLDETRLQVLNEVDRKYPNELSVGHTGGASGRGNHFIPLRYAKKLSGT